MEIDQVPVFILCGGLGTRLQEETAFRPKPMVPIGTRPIVEHIMRWYAGFGFKRFVLCMGSKSQSIRQYFLNFPAMNSDATIDLGSNRIDYHGQDHRVDWKVTLAYTGEASMTGARVAIAAARYLGDHRHLAVTYGDGLTDADMGREFEAHLSHGKLGTVLGVNPPSRFGEFKMSEDKLLRFAEKPDLKDAWINGGYFFFHRDFLRYLSADPACVLEREPLTKLASDGQLEVFKHHGFWACMDTQRDRDHLNELWSSGQAPWAAEPPAR